MIISSNLATYTSLDYTCDSAALGAYNTVNEVLYNVKRSQDEVISGLFLINDKVHFRCCLRWIFYWLASKPATMNQISRICQSCMARVRSFPGRTMKPTGLAASLHSVKWANSCSKVSAWWDGSSHTCQGNFSNCVLLESWGGCIKSLLLLSLFDNDGNEFWLRLCEL